MWIDPANFFSGKNGKKGPSLTTQGWGDVGPFSLCPLFPLCSLYFLRGGSDTTGN